MTVRLPVPSVMPVPTGSMKPTTASPPPCADLACENDWLKRNWLFETVLAKVSVVCVPAVASVTLSWLIQLMRRGVDTVKLTLSLRPKCAMPPPSPVEKLPAM
jgi:hypothetical protein